MKINKKISEDLKFAIIVAQWNSDVTHKLYKGAYDTLIQSGILEEKIKKWEVPGSYELIYSAKKIALCYNFDSIIVIGSIIKGKTPHFEYLCQAVSQGIKDINIKYDVPVIFCVLTDKNKKQSFDRSGGKNGNKGIECAKTALNMALFKKSME
ncbi:MAG: 6,7-dimethyl-8-ribityllumazine synthase [Flavobacteriales bacterium]|jgi:6,7-dimethyl-8-ribityllumazine synthase|uniref:6,7-dimethyl-8-ribityllumazine synthase n=1 Tax=Blattabacterium sp. (Mastotermes darwiniensis) TaxID=39768 RepID=UPI000231DE0E|nr:6,7-dimethyl-8-ribityllumazine synthase [Blattabacterium sp. (Mastotermes darwiniensis)]AER40578.1 riboflavin synthase subunit beta [Blattabacterium sp. (Mastotermes darwiniensis) str. MADAR]MDR1805075.1 6,7-dimethyl-8-ribityllumazine synthase [Flavobacteriales bacterium]